MKVKDNFDTSMASIKVGDTVSVFLGTGTRIQGLVSHVGDDYISIKKMGHQPANVRMKAVVSWQYQNEE